jgi:hypothetical protein
MIYLSIKNNRFNIHIYFTVYCLFCKLNFVINLIGKSLPVSAGVQAPAEMPLSGNEVELVA